MSGAHRAPPSRGSRAWAIAGWSVVGLLGCVLAVLTGYFIVFGWLSAHA